MLFPLLPQAANSQVLFIKPPITVLVMYRYTGQTDESASWAFPFEHLKGSSDPTG